MSGATPNLQLTYLEPAQAQKHVTVNENTRLLDALVQSMAVSRTVAVQPASPVDGDVYILPTGKTGAAWGSMGNGAIAHWRDGVWAQIVPRAGWTVFVRDEGQHLVFSGVAWGPILSAAQTSGFRNRLLNGAFALNQRGATGVGDDAYCFDRWYILTEAGNVTVSALADPETGRLTGIRLAQPDVAAKRIGLAQIVESANIRDLRNVAAAMAARVRCSASQAVRIAILEWTGAADAVTSDVVNNWTSGTFTASNFFIAGVNVVATGATTPGANTWTDLAQITGAFGLSMTNAIVMVWTEGALAQNATLDIDQVQLEPGALCGAFARRPLGEELALCQRYFFKTFPYATAPAQNAGRAGCISFPSLGASVFHRIGFRFPVPMRVKPAFTFYSPSAASAQAHDFDAAAACGSTGALGGGAGDSADAIALLTQTPATSAAGNWIVLHMTADAEL